RWERGDLDQREAATQESRGSMEAELVSARDRLHACESDQSRLNGELEDARRDEAELAEALNEMRTSIAVERRAKEAQEAQQQPMEARLSELREIAVRRETEIGAFMQRIEAATGENAALAEELE